MNRKKKKREEKIDTQPPVNTTDENPTRLPYNVTWSVFGFCAVLQDTDNVAY